MQYYQKRVQMHELFASPICAFGSEDEFALDFCTLCNSISRYGSATSPDINGDKSGEPNTFVTLVKLPTSILVIAESNFLKFLVFKSINEGVIVSISYPRTYALPGSI